jgi:hypothetical protein
MKLGIMQPYFFPYIGYFDLINRTDEWIVFDTVQYIRHGWVNRNRILHPTNGWQYIIVPLEKHHRETAIRDIRINSAMDWSGRIVGQLQHYRGRAPFCRETEALVRSAIDPSERSLVRQNVKALCAVCSYLSIPFRYRILSEMNIDLGLVDSPGDWALRICVALGATEYLNPPGGEELFDQEAFSAHGIRLLIQESAEFHYTCAPYEFTPALSILDAIMWNEPASIRSWLMGRATTRGEST